ncbi:MAG: tubulin-like doman-containing protein [Haloarculaceae archaeon]
MNFPDRIFAIGGAGKEIAFQLFEKDWILREILRPRRNPGTVTVTILDSAEEEENEDLQRVADIEQRVGEIESEVRDPEEGRTGTIDIQYKLITGGIQLNSSIDLLGDEEVPKITDGNGMDEEDWWLDENYINENLDFAKGVVRKRGLGKAIYYKAYARDDTLSQYVDLPQKGEVAVLVGLGGGTGSGILIDLAQQIKEKQRTAEITTFGILPNHTEGVKESTNAMAVLSELEYLALNEENVFNDNILVPIDPTNFDGKKGDRIKTKAFLEELDEAMIYLITSYYNTQNLEDPFADSPSFAPFTIGIPQILRYRVESINESRESVRETLEAKQEALQVEDEIYSSIQRFLDRNYPEAEEGLRDLDESDLRERLNGVKDLLELELFTELNYESIDIFKDIITDAEAEGDGLGEQISLMSTSLRASGTPGEVSSFVDDIDEHLAEILEHELELIGRRKELLEHRKAIDDNNVRNAIEFLLRSGDSTSNAGVRLNQVESRLSDLEDQRERLEAELEDTESELEELREEQSEKVERTLDDWRQTVSSDIESLRQCDIDAIEGAVRDLENHLEVFSNKVEASETIDEVNQLTADGVRQDMDELEDFTGRIGMSFERTRRDIEESIAALKRSREAHLKLNQEESFTESVVPWETESEQQRQEGNKEYQLEKNTIDDKGVFEIGLPTDRYTAECTFNGDNIVREATQQRDDLRKSVVDALRQRVETLDQNHVRELRGALEENPSIDRVSEIAREALWDDVSATDDLEERKAEIEDELETVTAEIDIYEPTIDIFQELSSRRNVWENAIEEFNAKRASLDEDTDTRVHTDDDFIYVKNIKPDDIFRATGSENLADSDVLSDTEEARRIENNIEQLAKNARNQQYTGIGHRKLSKGNRRYEDIRVRIAFASQAVSQIDTSAMDMESQFRSAFNLGGTGDRSQRYTTWRSDVGGPWDIGFTVYIDGIFLDNIRKVIQADGYFDGYQQRLEQLGDDILMHHGYGLDQGFYVRRDDLLNMEDPEDVEVYLQSEPDVVEQLLDGYVKRHEVSRD